MYATLLNLWLFAQVIAKVAVITGFAPGIAVTLCYELFFRRRSARLIPFPKPRGPQPQPRAYRKAA
jgi:hypothetical protein